MPKARWLCRLQMVACPAKLQVLCASQEGLYVRTEWIASETASTAELLQIVRNSSRSLGGSMFPMQLVSTASGYRLRRLQMKTGPL